MSNPAEAGFRNATAKALLRCSRTKLVSSSLTCVNSTSLRLGTSPGPCTSPKASWSGTSRPWWTTLSHALCCIAAADSAVRSPPPPLWTWDTPTYGRCGAAGEPSKRLAWSSSLRVREGRKAPLRWSEWARRCDDGWSLAGYVHHATPFR